MCIGYLSVSWKRRPTPPPEHVRVSEVSEGRRSLRDAEERVRAEASAGGRELGLDRRHDLVAVAACV
jgi:hypothetical protein